MARTGKTSLPCANDRGGISLAAQSSEASDTLIRLADLPIGARLLIRSRTDWRTAAVSRIIEETSIIVLTVCSPSGHSYRLRRDPATEVIIDGGFAILPSENEDTWRDNFSRYDVRW